LDAKTESKLTVAAMMYLLAMMIKSQPIKIKNFGEDDSMNKLKYFPTRATRISCKEKGE
jgi:hypothetical protein